MGYGVQSTEVHCLEQFVQQVGSPRAQTKSLFTFYLGFVFRQDPCNIVRMTVKDH